MIVPTVGALFAAARSKIGAYVAAVVAVVAVLAGTLLAGRRQGRAAARVKALEEDVGNVATRKEVERAVAREPAPAERLRNQWGRD